jgi:hypothetical protein
MDRSRLPLHRTAFAFAVAAVLSACAEAGGPDSAVVESAPYRAGVATEETRVAYDAAPEAPTGAATGEAVITLAAHADATRSVIRRARLELSVADTDEAVGEITELAERLGGYVGDLTARRHDYLLFYDLTLRVPTPRYGEAVTELKEMATRVESESRSTEDVTDQLVDLGARLETLRGVEIELRALLAESRRQGRDVAAIMEIYRQLTEIRTQIEQLDARMASLERETAFSAIQVTLAPDAAGRPILDDDWRPGETVREAFAMLVGVLQATIDVAIFAGVFLLPLALLAGTAVLAGARFMGRRATQGPSA